MRIKGGTRAKASVCVRGVGQQGGLAKACRMGVSGSESLFEGGDGGWGGF